MWRWFPASASGIWSGGSGRTAGRIPDQFEQRALRITGTAFYVLTAGLAITAVVDLYRGHRPENTFWGIVISLVSIASMWLLIRAKVSVGKKLNSQAILADAACTRACLQLSVVLLIASAGYRLTGIGGLDSVGALIIGGLCFREGKEAFEKARAGSFACTCGGSCKEGSKADACRKDCRVTKASNVGKNVISSTVLCIRCYEFRSDDL